MSRATITVSVDSLLRLPAEATYRSHSGQASAEVSRKGDTIYVTATCDSLAREVEHYEELYYRARDALENYEKEAETQKEKSTLPWGDLITTLGVGFAIGAVIMTIITIIIAKRHE